MIRYVLILSWAALAVACALEPAIGPAASPPLATRYHVVELDDSGKPNTSWVETVLYQSKDGTYEPSPALTLNELKIRISTKVGDTIFFWEPPATRFPVVVDSIRDSVIYVTSEYGYTTALIPHYGRLQTDDYLADYLNEYNLKLQLPQCNFPSRGTSSYELSLIHNVVVGTADTGANNWQMSSRYIQKPVLDGQLLSRTIDTHRTKLSHRKRDRIRPALFIDRRILPATLPHFLNFYHAWGVDSVFVVHHNANYYPDSLDLHFQAYATTESPEYYIPNLSALKAMVTNDESPYSTSGRYVGDDVERKSGRTLYTYYFRSPETKLLNLTVEFQTAGGQLYRSDPNQRIRLVEIFDAAVLLWNGLRVGASIEEYAYLNPRRDTDGLYVIEPLHGYIGKLSYYLETTAEGVITQITVHSDGAATHHPTNTHNPR